jgi:hypothetical protein
MARYDVFTKSKKFFIFVSMTFQIFKGGLCVFMYKTKFITILKKVYFSRVTIFDWKITKINFKFQCFYVQLILENSDRFDENKMSIVTRYAFS